MQRIEGAAVLWLWIEAVVVLWQRIEDSDIPTAPQLLLGQVLRT